MNRISTISTHITPTPSISYVNPSPTLGSKLKYAPVHFLTPIWVLSPLICFYKLLTGSADTKLNLLLILIYQYFFYRKTKVLRSIMTSLKMYRFYDSYELIFEDDEALLQSQRSIFPFHPHGIICGGMGITANSHPFFKDAEVVGSRMATEIPWGGLVMKFYGIEGVNPENFANLMKEGKKIMFVPGGFEEATITRYGKDRVFIKRRKGFIKMALEFGYHVYPCYTFGENRLFHTYTNETLGLLLNKLKMPGVMVYSKNLIFPNDNVKLSTIVGKGIKMPIIPNPTQEQVDKYHTIYIEKLVEMYDRWKAKCGGNDKLEVL